MRYEMYLATTQEAARANNGVLEPLAADYVGVRVAVEGVPLMLVLDMDEERGWTAWRERPEGGRCCDAAITGLGWVPVDDLWRAAYDALCNHRCASHSK